MQETISLLAIIGALAAGTISPGPSFVMVAREAVAASRGHALFAALGMGVGGAAFAAAALAGLQAALLTVPSLYLFLKVLGGAYLFYLGFRIWKSASLPLDARDDGTDAAPRSVASAFLSGLITQMSNPKTAVVYASVFAALLPKTHSSTFAFILVGAVFLLEAGWYGLVASVLSTDLLRKRYLACKSWIDRTAGAVMCLLGLRLIVVAQRP
ncbi:MAG TPA: LysE family translocator [Burkholderiaceae bacterium]|nr:LysE family translocator [Burkholderiaceae bacterium]